MLMHEQVVGVSFSGSKINGSKVASLAGKHIKKSIINI
jgi:hypothetical protein